MTLGLAMICKDDSKLKPFLNKYAKYFDEIYITFNEGTEHALLSDNIKVSYRKWTNDFAAQRNYNLEQVKTDYWLWVDDDDEIINPEELKGLAAQMEQEKIDALYLGYDYEQNEQGECIQWQSRERIIRTAYPWKWKGKVHETLVPPEGNRPVLSKSDAVTIKHIKTQDEMESSAKRNHEILLESWKEEKDPRTAYYLGISYFNLKEFDKAVEMFYEHIKTSGWPEEIYKSYLYISECNEIQHRFKEAIDSAHEAIKILPEHTDGYIFLAQIYFEMERWNECLHYLNIALRKPIPQTLSVSNPTIYEYRGLFVGALANLYLGRVDEAYKLIREVLKRSPKNKEALRVYPLFDQAYYEAEALKRVKWLYSYLKENKGDPRRVIEALPKNLRSDIRLYAERQEIYPPKKWGDKSIVFYCGAGLEEWGPDTLHKGMGGSEEAIVYLSRELAKIGWIVTVYNDRSEEYNEFFDIGEEYDEEYAKQGKNRDYYIGTKIQTAVHYLPFTTFNPEDEFNVIIAWRNPSFFNQGIKAKFKGVDMHDTPIGHQEIQPKDLENVDKFFFKSQFQADMSKIPKEKYVIVGNGIVPGQFA